MERYTIDNNKLLKDIDSNRRLHAEADIRFLKLEQQNNLFKEFEERTLQRLDNHEKRL